MMYRLFVFQLLFLGVCFQKCLAGSVPLDSVYSSLDNAIKHSDRYVDEKVKIIDTHRQQLNKAEDLASRYDGAFQCFSDYRAFDNDSALHYLFYCLELSKKMNRRDLQSYCNILIGHQYVVSGYFNEAQHYFDISHAADLRPVHLNTYYYYMNHYYRELSMYGYDKQLRRQYSAMAASYLDSVSRTLKPSDALYFQRKCIGLFFNGDYQEAMRINDEWMQHSKPGTQGYANMAYYRSEIYRIRHNYEQQKYWLAIAATNELKCSVMNQLALWTLAEIINKEGDVSRAFSYVDCSWKSISRFSTHKRSWIVTPVLLSISKSYRAKLAEVNTRVMWLLGITLLLTVFLLGSLVTVLRAKRITNRALLNLQKANEELSNLNKKLSNLNTHLLDSNRVKDQYISSFFRVCSEYIDKLDKYRLKINRKLKANQVKEVIHFTSSEQLKEDELKMLLGHFDKVFLNLFPTFVYEFNALLKPEARIEVHDNSSLNTSLRIFALIRLGIDESSKIAEFLNYSPNSIYAYRSRVKNGALHERGDFENMVKRIGIEGNMI